MRLFDVDRVDEPETAAKVEPRDDAHRDVVLHELRAVDLAVARRLERGPHAEKRAEPDRRHEAGLEAPSEVHHRQSADERPDGAEGHRRENPENSVVRGSCGGERANAPPSRRTSGDAWKNIRG